VRTKALRELLRKRVLGPEGQGAKAVLLEEVPPATGFASGAIDAVSVGMWPSRGCLVEGYELKVSRGDWLGELKEPAKAENLARFCDRFWLVVGDDKVIKDGEVPAPWGILRAKGGRLLCDREPADLEPQDRPPAFIAALLRRAVKADVKREMKIAREEAKHDAERQAKSKVASAENRADQLEQELEEFRRDWAAFEQLTGVAFPYFLRREQHDFIREVAKVVLALREVEGKRHSPVAVIDSTLDRMGKAMEALKTAREGISLHVAEEPTG
jgi:hypothetical protein